MQGKWNLSCSSKRYLSPDSALVLLSVSCLQYLRTCTLFIQDYWTVVYEYTLYQQINGLGEPQKGLFCEFTESPCGQPSGSKLACCCPVFIFHPRRDLLQIAKHLFCCWPAGNVCTPSSANQVAETRLSFQHICWNLYSLVTNVELHGALSLRTQFADCFRAQAL